MDTSSKAHSIKNSIQNKSAHASKAAGDLLDDGKDLAHEIYKKGQDQASEIENYVKEYSDEILQKVKENPLASVLIAAGVGYLLSSIFKK